MVDIAVSTNTPTSPSSTGSSVPGLSVLGADHLVLRVADVEASLAFYVEKLGLEPERLEGWRAGKVPFPSVRVSPTFVIDLDARRPADGKNVEHFCLEIETTSLRQLWGSGEFATVGEPVRRWGARGEADLIYIQDPDGNIIELRHYGPSEGLEYGVRA